MKTVDSWKGLEDHLRTEYKASDDIVQRTTDNLRRILAFAGADFSYWKKLDCLDLGCGSVITPDSRDRVFEPWIARSLKALSTGRIVGIDRYPNDGELFEHHQADLRYPETLASLSTESFDLVMNMRFCAHEDMPLAGSSPVLINTLAQLHIETALDQIRSGDFDPTSTDASAFESAIMARVAEDIAALRQGLYVAAYRLLRRPGMYVWDHLIVKK